MNLDELTFQSLKNAETQKNLEGKDANPRFTMRKSGIASWLFSKNTSSNLSMHTSLKRQVKQTYKTGKTDRVTYLENRSLNFGAGLGLFDVQEDSVNVEPLLGDSLSPVVLWDDVILDQRYLRSHNRATICRDWLSKCKSV